MTFLQAPPDDISHNQDMEVEDMAQGNLGVLFNNLRGKAGSVSFARSKDGTVIKPRITVKNPRTPAQQAVRAALVTASRTYKGFTAVQVSNWTLAASAITKRSARTSKAYVPTGNAYFVSLATKLLQINPAATLPVTPPSAVFAGRHHHRHLYRRNRQGHVHGECRERD